MPHRWALPTHRATVQILGTPFGYSLLRRLPTPAGAIDSRMSGVDGHSVESVRNEPPGTCAEHSQRVKLREHLGVHGHTPRLGHTEVAGDEFHVDLGLVEHVEALDRPRRVTANAERDHTKAHVRVGRHAQKMAQLSRPYGRITNAAMQRRFLDEDRVASVTTAQIPSAFHAGRNSLVDVVGN